jgi:hypothetical protein
MRHALVLALLLAGCSAHPYNPPPSITCREPETEPCYCEAVRENGTQTCSPDGLRWSACECPSQPRPDAGPFFCYDGGCMDGPRCNYGNGPHFFGSSGGACEPDGG